MFNVLVIGGAGFIGSHLVDRLINLGYNVDIIDNLSTGLKENINIKANFFNINICNYEELSNYIQIKQPNIIFHLAAQINLRYSFDDPTFDANTNIIGSLNVIKLAKQYNIKIIFASTGGAIYSPEASLPWDEFSEANPLSPYGLAKLTIEKYLNILNVNHVILRLSNVYGPRQNSKSEAGVISIFIDNILNQSDLKIFGDGLQTRDFIYVHDVVNAFILSMNNEINGIFNVSTGVEYSILDTANYIIDKMWANNNIIYFDSIPGELRHSRLSNNKLKSTNKWKQEISFNDGLNLTIKYFIWRRFN